MIQATARAGTFVRVFEERALRAQFVWCGHKLIEEPCSICLQGTGKGSQGDAMYEVVSLQKHTECAAGARGRLQSPTEEEEPEEGTSPSSLSECFYVCCHFFIF